MVHCPLRASASDLIAGDGCGKIPAGELVNLESHRLYARGVLYGPTLFWEGAPIQGGTSPPELGRGVIYHILAFQYITSIRPMVLGLYGFFFYFFDVSYYS